MTRLTRQRLKKLAALNLREYAELAQAQLELVAAQFIVRTRARGRLVSPATADPTQRVAAIDPRAERIAVSIRRAADHGLFRAHCLVRAIATNRMLERRGISGSQIRIGVRTVDQRIVAHAWLEYGGRVIGDTQANVDRYSELTGVRLVEFE